MASLRRPLVPALRLPRACRGLLTALAALAGAALPLAAQDGASRVPFGIGESMNYDVRFGPLSVGSGRMDVVGLDTVRGKPSFHVRLELRAGVPGFRVVNVLESWMERSTLHALRYKEETSQGGRNERKVVEIFPERRAIQETVWRPAKGGPGVEELRRPESPSVADPLDQASFLFFARAQPLDVGKEYSYDRYYKPSSNPVTLSVVRREQVTVPAGTFNTIVVRPLFRSNGIFGQNGRAEVWLTDDDRRLMVRMETHVAFGTIVLQLKEFTGGGSGT